jgi:hypothetical protein
MAMSWRELMGAEKSTPLEFNPYNPLNTNSTDITDKTPRGSDTAEPASVCTHPIHSNSAPAGHSATVDNHRLADFHQLVRSAGVDHGVCLDTAQVARWLPGPDRAQVQDGGQMGRKERSTMAQHLALRIVTARGIVPDGWTDFCLCEKCGPVWAVKGSDASVSACIWCDLRRARQWFPRPRMQCGQCRHLKRDRVNPAGGLGSCGKGHDSEWLCFPHSRRPCADWRGGENTN